jgi:hypothetical protein
MGKNVTNAEESAMETVGIVATVIVGLIVLGGLVVIVRSIPDLLRYRKIRSM